MRSTASRPLSASDRRAGIRVAGDGAVAGSQRRRHRRLPSIARASPSSATRPSTWSSTTSGSRSRASTQVTDACGIELSIADPKGDAAAQVSGIENLIAAGVQGVGIVSIDPVAIKTAVEAAHTANIPVVSQVSTFEGADSYVGLPEHEFGRLQGVMNGQALLALKPGKESYKVAVLNADSLGAGLLDRKQGLIDGLNESVTNYTDRLGRRGVGRGHRAVRGRDHPPGQPGPGPHHDRQRPRLPRCPLRGPVGRQGAQHGRHRGRPGHRQARPRRCPVGRLPGFGEPRAGGHWTDHRRAAHQGSQGEAPRDQRRGARRRPSPRRTRRSTSTSCTPPSDPGRIATARGRGQRCPSRS